MTAGWWIKRFTPFTGVWRNYGPGAWWRSFRCGIRNLIIYSPVIWRQRDFDYSYLLELMALKMRRMAHHHSHFGSLVNSERTAAELNRCACICERIAKGELGSREDDGNLYFTRQDRRQRDYLEYVTTMMRKHLYCWWD